MVVGSTHQLSIANLNTNMQAIPAWLHLCCCSVVHCCDWGITHGCKGKKGCIDRQKLMGVFVCSFAVSEQKLSMGDRACLSAVVSCR